jgi:hypothetical protein
MVEREERARKRSDENSLCVCGGVKDLNLSGLRCVCLGVFFCVCFGRSPDFEGSPLIGDKS